MTIRFSSRALADLEGIFEHVAGENRRAASALVTRIELVIAMLAEHPKAGRPTHPAGRRVLTVPRLPYRVFYRIIGDDVFILRIRHTSRRPIGS
jgi:addiction module RelE/StbE family toxin